MSKLRFIGDLAHRWLEVPAEEVRRLGIADKISTYSYISADGKLAYLEEDADFSLYARAKEERGEDWRYYTSVHQGNTFVRTLPAYDVNRLAADAGVKARP